MTSPSVVRQAVPSDHAEVWRLLRLLWDESAMFEMSEQKVGNFVNRFLSPQTIKPDDRGPRGIAGVIGDIGSLEAIIMLNLGSPWYTDAIALDEVINFVDPRYRASNHARALIGYAKMMADALREDHPDLRLMIGCVTTKRTAAKVRLYSRHFVQAGAHFIYPPPPSFDENTEKSRGGLRHRVVS